MDRSDQSDIPLAHDYAGIASEKGPGFREHHPGAISSLRCRENRFGYLAHLALTQHLNERKVLGRSQVSAKGGFVGGCRPAYDVPLRCGECQLPEKQTVLGARSCRSGPADIAALPRSKSPRYDQTVIQVVWTYAADV